MATSESKLTELAKLEGYGTTEELLIDKGSDGVVPAICLNEACNHTEGMEPDQAKGWCPDCSTNSMASCLVLAHLI